MSQLEICPGCLALYQVEQPSLCSHPYIGASEACWQRYGQFLTKEYEDPEFFRAHRLTVDAYCAQHIGDQSDRRARQSANVHLIALYLNLEKKMTTDTVLSFIHKATKRKRDWPAFEQRTSPQWLTVKELRIFSEADEHCKQVQNWAQSVLDEYKPMWPSLEQMYKELKD